MRSVTFRLFALCAGLLMPTPLLAQTNLFCEAAVIGRADPLNDWDQLPSVESGKLPDRFVEALNHHPKVQALRARYGMGEKLAFRFGVRFTGNDNGWAIQGEFLKKVLNVIFPETGNTIPGVTRRQIPIEMEDSTMADVPGDAIDIGILKAANPGTQLPDKKTLRQMMNIPEKARVVSLYMSWTEVANLDSVMTAIFKNDLADVIIISVQKGNGPPSRSLDNDELKAMGVEVVGSWALKRRSENFPSKAIVVNNTRGRMPYMYRVADFAVVLGMANPIEPLLAERPMFITRKVAPGYNQAQWSAILGKSVATGGAHLYTDANDLVPLIQNQSQAAPKIPVYETKDEGGQTPLDNLLVSIKYLLE